MLFLCYRMSSDFFQSLDSDSLLQTWSPRCFNHRTTNSSPSLRIFAVTPSSPGVLPFFNWEIVTSSYARDAPKWSSLRERTLLSSLGDMAGTVQHISFTLVVQLTTSSKCSTQSLHLSSSLVTLLLPSFVSNSGVDILVKWFFNNLSSLINELPRALFLLNLRTLLCFDCSIIPPIAMVSLQ